MFCATFEYHGCHCEHRNRRGACTLSYSRLTGFSQKWSDSRVVRVATVDMIDSVTYIWWVHSPDTRQSAGRSYLLMAVTRHIYWLERHQRASIRALIIIAICAVYHLRRDRFAACTRTNTRCIQIKRQFFSSFLIYLPVTWIRHVTTSTYARRQRTVYNTLRLTNRLSGHKMYIECRT